MAWEEAELLPSKHSIWLLSLDRYLFLSNTVLLLSSRGCIPEVYFMLNY
jgi:hypothetical protein